MKACTGAHLQRPFTAARLPLGRQQRLAAAHRSGRAHATPSTHQQVLEADRRQVVVSLPAMLLALTSLPGPAAANPLQDLTRKAMRPDELTPEQAVVALLDARSTLRDMQVVVATSEDSQERFQARRQWPAYAKWLREVGPSVPVVSAVINSADKEALLSAQYGGTAGEAPGPVDAVYEAFGKVLTISGRTIREDAQRSPAIVKQAQDALDGLLAKVPQQLLDSAQEFRIQRAAAAGRA